MTKWLMLFAVQVMMTAPAFAQSEFPCPSADVKDMIERSAACKYWQSPEALQEENTETVQKNISDLNCEEVNEDLADITRASKGNERKMLQDYDHFVLGYPEAKKVWEETRTVACDYQ